MSTQHKYIPSSESHEPKGIEAAFPNSVYVSDGNGSGEWRTQSAMNWRGSYIPDSTKIYFKNDVVIDEHWTMIANKDTYDRPAPQYAGSPATDQPDAQSFTDQTHTGTVVSGQEYTMSQGGWITKIDVYIPALAGTIHDVFIKINGEAVTVSPYELAEDGWTSVVTGNILVKANDVVTVEVGASSSTANTQFIGTWLRAPDANGALPSSGEWNKSTQQNTLRVSNNDSLASDRNADLLTATAGSTVLVEDTLDSGKYIHYYINSTTNSTGCVEYDVAVIETGPNGQPAVGNSCTLTFTVPTPAAVLYSQNANYWSTNQPSWASVKGLLKLDSVASVVPDNAYGARLGFQPAYISPDWDLVAYSGA